MENTETARVFLCGYAGSDELVKKCLASAEASGNDTSKWILVRTDSSVYDSKHRKLMLSVPQGHPVSANHAFMQVASLCQNNKDNFIFLDPDVTFLRPNAVELLSQELEGRMGQTMHKAHWVQNEKYRGWYGAMGVVACKWDTFEKYRLARFPIPDDEPLDLWLSKRFFGEYMAPTGLIEEDQVTPREYGEISAQAVVWHGDKTGKLCEEVIAEYAHA